MRWALTRPCKGTCALLGAQGLRGPVPLVLCSDLMLSVLLGPTTLTLMPLTYTKLTTAKKTMLAASGG